MTNKAAELTPVLTLHTKKQKDSKKIRDSNEILIRIRKC